MPPILQLNGPRALDPALVGRKANLPRMARIAGDNQGPGGISHEDHG